MYIYIYIYTVVMITDLNAGDRGSNPSRDKTSSSKGP